MNGANLEYVSGFWDGVTSVVELAELDMDAVELKTVEPPNDGYGPWPRNKALNDMLGEFDEIGTECAHEFCGMWLAVNMAIRDSMLRASVEPSDTRIRWLAFHIARGLCRYIVHREEEIETES